MSNTLTLIQKITVGATPVSQVLFENIPQNYTDLKIICSNRDNRDATNSEMFMRVNGVDASSARRLYGTGITAQIGTTTTGAVGIGNANQNTTNSFSSTEILISNYTSSNFKSVTSDSIQSHNASANIYQYLINSVYNTTSPVTNIRFTSEANFVQHSTFYLYGVTKFGVTTPSTAAAYATGGDSITTDGTYWIHTFRSSGTFTPKKALSNVDYLVVAGGGGGARGADNTGSGGGGAGGYRTSIGGSAVSFSNNVSYTVTVGAGGAAGTTTNQQGPAGSNSSISGTGITTVTSTGGAGGISQYSARASGGSGGGGESFTASGAGSAGNAGGYTPVEGYAGGSAGPQTQRYGGGGGGGSSAIGGTGSNTAGGAGGAGTSNSISGSSITYAGGGGGGLGAGTGGSGGAGSAGGGNGGTDSVNGGSATANTGSGGGGGCGKAGVASNGGGGGSGIVIVRYPV